MKNKYYSDIIDRWSIPEPNSGCWIWLGRLHNSGYAYVYDKLQKKTAYVHRISYENAKGPIPKGLSIDHICEIRCCVNPDHLQVVTQSQNNLRRSARRMFCPKGHYLSLENIIVLETRNGVRCRICHLDRQNKYDNLKRAKGIKWWRKPS